MIETNGEDEWLGQLRQVYEADRARQQAKEERPANREPVITAGRLLERCRAHELMRQVQKALLNGGGKLQFYEKVGGYDQVIVLMWKGPISDAARPENIRDVETAIIVGASDEGIFVNDDRLSEASPEALRRRLLDLARGFAADKGA